MAETVNEEKNQQEQLQQQHNFEGKAAATAGDRIFLVTDGLRSKYTKTNYRLAFKQFLEHGAKTHDLRVLLDYKPKVIEQMIIGYVEMLTDKGKAHQTIRMHCAAIFHFFRMNDITLNQHKITRFVPPDESGHMDKAYDVDEIRRILEASDPRTRVIVFVMVSTGMRIGAIPGLTVGDLFPIPEYNLYRIDVYATSKSASYFTYCTPECKIAIDAYLDYRRRLGEKIMDKSPLIREMFDSHNPFIINSPKRATERMIHLALEQALKRSGVNQRTIDLGRGKRRGIMRSHGFRKFYVTQMKKARVNFSDREYLVGHKVSRGLDINYDRTPEEDRLSEYAKAIDFLTIDSNQRLQKKVQELENDQGQEIARLKWREGQQAQEIVELKTQLKDVQLQTKGNKSREAQVLTKLQEKDVALQSIKNKYDTDIALLKEAITDMQQLLKNPKQLQNIS